MEKLIGINPVTEALKNKKDIEYLEIFKGINEEKVKEIKELASKANIKIKKTDKHTRPITLPVAGQSDQSTKSKGHLRQEHTDFW